MEITIDERIEFLNVVIRALKFGCFKDDEEKDEWISRMKILFGEDKFNLLRSCYIFILKNEDDVDKQIIQLQDQKQQQQLQQQLLLQQQQFLLQQQQQQQFLLQQQQQQYQFRELQIRELEIREAASTKRLQETELTKRLQETESTRRKELEVAILTEGTRQLQISNGNSKIDSGYDYCAQFFTGRESLTTSFTQIFDGTSLVYSGSKRRMDWLGKELANEDEYQTLFNDFLKKFGTEQINSQKIIINNQTSNLYYCDTHASHDGLVDRFKPDITVYLSNQNGEYPGPNPFKFCFFIELQLNDFDKTHAHDIIRRSEIVMKRTPNRSHAYTLWLTQDSLVVHKVKREIDSFKHTFSSTTSLNIDYGKNILYYFLTCTDPNFFGIPMLAEDIENYLITNNYTPTDFLGGGAFSQVLKISTSDSKSYALKIYRYWDEKHQYLKQQEVHILNLLDHVNAVPSIIHEENNWILLDKVCEPLKKTDITQSFVDKLLSALNQVHSKGVIWGDCRPDNLGIIDGEPLLIDWNLAVEQNEPTSPHNGTRCFISQRLLRTPSNQRIERFPDDDKESLLKSLIEIQYPGIRKIINAIDDPIERANKWETRYPILKENIDEAFRLFKAPLSAF